DYFCCSSRTRSTFIF
nr:immunoglobulin light chain junction region [Macaca mulatta]